MLHLLFPDFDFGTDFLYGPSGRAIFQCFGLSPHRIASQSPARLRERLCKNSRIQRASVDRLLAQARASVTNVKPPRVVELLEYELALAWQDLELQQARRENARTHLETLHDEIRTEDARIPNAQPGVISKVALARLFAEVGPLGHYQSWRQVLRMGGLNLCERKSGKYVGQTKISRAGRSAIRVILNQIALPLVKRDRLFGPYYHHKIGVQKMSGKKAMTAVARKVLKMIWGWYHSAAAFDAARVFHCESEYRRAA
jgi:transposase